MSTQPRTIIRDKHDSKYFAMSRATAQDERLSMEALGIITYLLSKPDSWEIQVPDLMRRAGCGKDKMYRILDELKEHGYLTGRERIQGEDGKFSWTPYVLHERPVIVEFPQSDAPLPEKPHTGEPEVGVPDTVNPNSLNNIEGENTEGEGRGSDNSNTTEKTEDPQPNQPKTDFKIIRDLLDQLGLLTSSTIIEKFKQDADDYTLEQWQRGTDIFKQRRKEKGQYLPYNYLIGVMRGVEAEDKQAALVQAAKPVVPYHQDAPVDNTPAMSDAEAQQALQEIRAQLKERGVKFKALVDDEKPEPDTQKDDAA